MLSAWRGGIWFLSGFRAFSRTGFAQNQKKFEGSDLEVDISEKVFLITGANSGLGFATAHAIALRGGTVYMLCRNQERGEKAREEIIEQTGNDRVHLQIIDVSSRSSIANFVTNWMESGERCDVLVNNAGVMPSDRQTTEDGIELTFATNTLGTFLLTNLMMPVLEDSAPSRVVIVSSGGALTQKMDLSDVQFEKGSFDGTLAYAQTKREQIYLGELFEEKYGDRGVSFFSMHPGWADTPGVASSMPSFYDKMKDSLRSPEEGADTIVWLSIAEKLENKLYGGKFFFDRAEADSHLPLCCTSSSKKEISQLWDICCDLSGWKGLESNENWCEEHYGED